MPRHHVSRQHPIGDTNVRGDINVTPLVDVCLVLLIIFMVVTPLLQKGVECTEIEVANWGLATSIPMPGGGAIGLYQPSHATAV